MVLTFGYQTVVDSWEVNEKTAPVFSRIYYIEKGDVFYTSDGITTKLKEGYLYCFPNTKSYMLKQNLSNKLKCFFIHVIPTPYTIEDLIEIDVEVYSEIKTLLNVMLDCHKKGFLKLNAELTDSLVKSLINILFQNCLINYLDERVRIGINYIIKNYKSEIDIAKLSKLSGYHEKYYIRLFKTCLNTTPSQFLRQYRMKIAYSLLFEGVTVSKAAEEVGYKDLKTFSNAFKNTYGFSPSNIKKQSHFN